MKHKRNPTREQVQTDVNLVKWGIQRAYNKTQELADAMKARDDRTRRDNCSRQWGFNKDEFKLLTEIVDTVIALLPTLTRLLRWAITHKLGGR